MEQLARAFLQAAFGHAVQQVRGGRHEDALAGKPGQDGARKVGNVLRHVALLGFEFLAPRLQLRAKLEGVDFAPGRGRAAPRRQ